MESIEMKTPLLRPKKYRKRKRTVEICKVEEFMSFGSSNYFNDYDDDCNLGDSASNHKSSIQTERSIEEYLVGKNAFMTLISAKKDEFFEESRQRVNSISFFEIMGKSDSTDISPINHLKGLTPPSLNLTPLNSKIHKKRFNCTSMSEIRMRPIMDPSALSMNRSKFSNMKPNQVLSDQKFKTDKEEATDFGNNLALDSKATSCLKHCSDL